MNQLADLIACAARPVMMAIVAAPIYKLGKLFVAPKKAAIFSLSLTTLLFLLELLSIQFASLRFTTAISTLVGSALLASIFWRRVASRD